MNSLTPTQRDLGLQRLRRLTFGATAGALIAVLGVGYVAAASYAGKSSIASSSTALDTTSSGTSASSGSLQSTQAPTTGSSGSGTVTSGGS